jgi:hypothetical protein
MKAFPTTKPLDSWGDPNAGMDLRDYFAAEALGGYIAKMGSDPKGQGSICEEGNYAQTNAEALAKSCYIFADAMMKARDE